MASSDKISFKKNDRMNCFPFISFKSTKNGYKMGTLAILTH